MLSLLFQNIYSAKVLLSLLSNIITVLLLWFLQYFWARIIFYQILPTSYFSSQTISSTFSQKLLFPNFICIVAETNCSICETNFFTSFLMKAMILTFSKDNILSQATIIPSSRENTKFRELDKTKLFPCLSSCDISFQQ